MSLTPATSVGLTSEQAAAAYIAKTLADAKGDLIAATAADTFARVAVGTDSYLPVADSTATPGIAWKNLGWTVVTKLADESVASSGVVQADDELFFTPANGGLYLVKLEIIYASPAGAGTPDIQLTFAEDATMRGTFNILGPSTGDGAAGSTIQAQTGSVASFGTAAANRMLTGQGTYFGSGAQASVFWAQATSGINATVVRAGSLLRYRRIL